MNTVPLISHQNFDNKLTLAMQGDVAAIKWIDSFTINRADNSGFDFFSKTSFWFNKLSEKDSVCFCYSMTYQKYKNFRELQDNGKIPKFTYPLRLSKTQFSEMLRIAMMRQEKQKEDGNLDIERTENEMINFLTTSKNILIMG